MNRRTSSLKMIRRHAIPLLVGLIGLPALAQADSEGWLMRGGDTRRTGRAQVAGPQIGVVAWSYLASDALSINMEPTVTNDHVFFGTWGVIRKRGELKEQWDRFDGTVYGLTTSDGTPAWNPPILSVTPYAYRYDGRPTREQDRGAGTGLHLSLYSGTVEGTAWRIGDWNGDGLIDGNDMPGFIECLLGGQQSCNRMDTDLDGVVNVVDIGGFVEMLLGTR